jgi:pSer/pThr/pTyr-binding forkhead associated (FHA) protein
MPMHGKSLGVMMPLGGGDPIPLKKEELTIGRRPTCDIRLDFENISGKHCTLRMVKGVWYVRDLNSTNGTTINGQLITSPHGVMPDDEFGIAGHLFMLDYDPVAPTQVMEANQVLEEELSEPRRRHSLMELAGLERERDRALPSERPGRAPEKITRRSIDEDFDQVAPVNLPDAPMPKVAASDDEFFQMIQEDVSGEDQPKKNKR